VLTELWVKNLALLENAQARFRPGFNVLTGETGAGKSLMVQALDLVLGARASADLVRRGARDAEIAARFEPGRDVLERAGEDAGDEDGVLVLRRVIGADGRSRAYVNDRPATVGRLRDLGAALADLHGQHEQQNLLREETHIGYLDSFAGNGPQAAAAVEAFAAYADAVAERDRFLETSRKAEEEKEFMLFQLAELEDAELTEGEEDALERERRLAAHAGKLAEAAGSALALLSEDSPSAASLLGKASVLLGKAAALDDGLEPLRRQLDEAAVQAEEIARELAGYAGGLESDPARLETIESRLDLLHRLQRKYAASVTELIARRDALRAEAEAWESSGETLDALNAAVASAGERLHAACTELSARRSRAAAAFARAVSTELRGLGMERAAFSVALGPLRQGLRPAGRRDPVGPGGAEDARFMLAANAGETAGPLARIASGGEASRVMLALKNVLRKVDPVPLVIFDEVDTGIGGVVAQAVASRLAGIARRRQVLVVTHLAVIAGAADHHLRLTKATEGKRTRIAVDEITGREREDELARMMAGKAGGEAARKTARSLLREGKAR
jgi:DNA repair protein RecN (Recombination protein N)